MLSRETCRRVGSTVLAVILVPAVVAAGLVTDVALYGQVTDRGPADAAVVLGAAVYGDVPSPVFEERIRHGVGLWQSGAAGLLVMTGGRSPEDRLSEAEAARDWALAQGLPAEKIGFEAASRTTEDNLAFARPVLQQHGAHRILLVSDPLHMRRAMAHARKLGLDAHPSPTPTTRYRSWEPWSRFLVREAYFFAKCRIQNRC
jgi:uncharacterized SAM-binding protein YcdF (DUF218 family)